MSEVSERAPSPALAGRFGLRPTPVWAWVVLGWLAGRLARDAARGPLHANEAALAFVRAAREREGPGLEEARRARSLDRVCVRELRALPGIDEARALDIARVRWERDWSAGPLRLSAIHGIGETTETAVAAWFAGRPPHELAELADELERAVWLHVPWGAHARDPVSTGPPQTVHGRAPAAPPAPAPEAPPLDRG